MSEMDELVKQSKNTIINYIKSKFWSKPLLEDFGDYIPFFAYLGERDFCEKQLNIAERLLKNGFYYNVNFLIGRIFKNTIFSIEYNTDTLLGFIDFYRISKNEKSLELAKRMIDSIEKYCFRDGHLYSLMITKIGKSLPVFRGLNGTYIELLVDLYSVTGEKKYLEMSESIAYKLLELDFFKKYKLFPKSYMLKYSFLNKIWRSSKIVSLFKENTAIINSFLTLYSFNHENRLKNAIFEWTESVRERLFDGTIYGIYDVERYEKSEASLSFSFPVIDLFCDCYNVFGNRKFLDFAKKIANFWLGHQSKIGLFPLYSNDVKTWQDTMTDFTISLFKLYECSKMEKYKESALRAIEGTLKYHIFPLQVNYKTGEIINNKVKDKYVALMLKLIIYYQSKYKIYENELLFKLLRDR